MSSANNVLLPLNSGAGDVAQIALARMAEKNSLSKEKAAATAKDFESVFLAQMMDEMFGESTGVDSFGDSETSEIYRGLMMQEYGKQMANSGGIGIADYVKAELLKQQEVK